VALLKDWNIEAGNDVVVDVSGLGGATVGLTGVVTGVAAGARSAPGVGQAEIELDHDQVAIVDRVLAYLQGAAEALQARAPRHRLALPAIVMSSTGHTFMHTFSVSLGGCGLAWSGPPPTTGRGLLVRLGGGPGAATFKAITCWVHGDARGTRVGVRFLAGDTDKLAALLAEARPGP